MARSHTPWPPRPISDHKLSLPGFRNGKLTECRPPLHQVGWPQTIWKYIKRCTSPHGFGSKLSTPKLGTPKLAGLWILTMATLPEKQLTHRIQLSVKHRSLAARLQADLDWCKDRPETRRAKIPMNFPSRLAAIHFRQFRKNVRIWECLLSIWWFQLSTRPKKKIWHCKSSSQSHLEHKTFEKTP